jgi:hypothetical protein
VGNNQTVRYSLSRDPADGCEFHVGIGRLEFDTAAARVKFRQVGVWQTHVPNEPEIVIASANIGDPDPCVEFVLMVAQKCGNAPPRLVGTRTFLICKVCP